jgi:hypothetical protein
MVSEPPQMCEAMQLTLLQVGHLSLLVGHLVFQEGNDRVDALRVT